MVRDAAEGQEGVSGPDVTCVLVTIQGLCRHLMTD